MAEKNGGEAAEGFTGVASIVKSHWNEYGRNFYSRYDYEDVNAEKATQVGDLQVIRAAFAPVQRFAVRCSIADALERVRNREPACLLTGWFCPMWNRSGAIQHGYKTLWQCDALALTRFALAQN